MLKLIDPKLLKFDPGLGFPPSARKLPAVVPEKVEFEKVSPPLVADVPGKQASPKQPVVEPPIKTSSARGDALAQNQNAGKGDGK